MTIVVKKLPVKADGFFCRCVPRFEPAVSMDDIEACGTACLQNRY